jgi:hypothetical protein
MSVVSKEEFMSILDAPLDEKVVSIGGKAYRLRELTEEGGIEYEKQLAKGGKFDPYRARRAMVSLCLVDEAGNRIIDDPDILKKMKLGIINTLHDECLALSRYRKDDVEETVKNLEPAQS